MYVRVVVEMKYSTSDFINFHQFSSFFTIFQYKPLESHGISELGAKIQVAPAADAPMHR